jgi:raffinose/stachyose/melibiose transport system substrate-binding protein
MAYNNGVDVWPALTDEFTKQYPNVTFDPLVKDWAALQTDLPRQMAGNEAPDLARLAAIGNGVKNNLLTNLDPYSAAYGWDKYPSSLLEQMQVGDDGTTRGSGHLYQMMAAGYNSVGVYYNKSVAKKLGMTQPPATLEEFEQLLEKAKGAGIIPIGQAGDVSYVYEELLYRFAADSPEGLKPVKDWLYGVKGASIDIEPARKAAETIQKWSKAGYFPADLSSIDGTSNLARIGNGESLLMVTGDWTTAQLDKVMGENAGFFTLPPVRAGGGYGAAGATQAWVIPAKAKNPDVAAFFINWVNTNDKARKITVDGFGSLPGGPTDLPVPAVPAGSLRDSAFTAIKHVTADNALVDFMANATAGMGPTTLVPQLQLLVAGQTTPGAFTKKLKDDYQAELGR